MMIADKPPANSERVTKPHLSGLSGRLVRTIFQSVAPSKKKPVDLSALISESYFRVEERLQKTDAEEVRRMIEASKITTSPLVDDLARIFYLILCSERSEEQYDLQLLEQLRHLVNLVLIQQFGQNKSHH